MYVCRVLFVRRKTAYELLISDWSSDVCSSDLPKQAEGGNAGADLRARPQQAQQQPAPDRPALMSALEIHMPPTTNMASTRRPQPCASPGSGNAIMHRRRNIQRRVIHAV